MRKIEIFDGGFGTELQKSGALKPGTCPELLNIENPDAVKAVHLSYI